MEKHEKMPLKANLKLLNSKKKRIQNRSAVAVLIEFIRTFFFLQPIPLKKKRSALSITGYIMLLLFASISMYKLVYTSSSSSSCDLYLFSEDVPKSSYESLTEELGTFKNLKDRRAEKEKLQPAQQDQKGTAALVASPPKTSSFSDADIAEEDTQEFNSSSSPNNQKEQALINFNGVSITEVLKYASRITGKNFIYDPDELQFSITMISETPTTVQDLIAMIIQNLEIHGFSLIEQGNSFQIFVNDVIKGVNELYGKTANTLYGPQIATQVFVLQNIEADRCAAIVKAMLSKDALVEVVESSKIIVSDLVANIKKLGEIIKKLDTQSNGLEIGQYVAVSISPSMITSLTERIMTPLAGNKPLIFVPHTASNSVFIVSTPYLIERSLAVMQTLDLNQAKSGVLWSEENKFDAKTAAEALNKIRAENDGNTTSSDRVAIPPELSKKEVDLLSRSELEQMLLDRGFTQSQVQSLNGQEAKVLLWQELNSLKEAKARATKRRQMYSESDLPIGTVEATQFLIYKLQYRKSSDVATALRAIAISLTSANAPSSSSATTSASLRPDIAQSDLVITLNSLQAVDDNNTVVFTGTRASLQKIKELISQIDIPVRQVFIEALVLDTSLNNSLEFGVEWGLKLGKENLGTQFGFNRSQSSSFAGAFNGVQQTTPNPISAPVSAGLSAGAIGRKIKFRGKGFRSTGALIHALHGDDETHIMMNPKITTEHNIAAEIFVGERIPIKGQSIANATTGSTSSIIATNYDSQDVGIHLKVTPLISSHDTVTLIIEQKVSTASQNEVQAQGSVQAPPATVRETRTTTRVHLPSDHFLVMSGMIREEKSVRSDRVPCLGLLPFVGSLFGDKLTGFVKRNLLIFVRPIIIDTPNDIDEITYKQEQILKAKSQVQQGWNKEMDDIRELLNL